ncbi:MAG TPA: ATP-binding protein [Kofleriaceae bacterium]|nr:ATP-binding protein [Kofleriaceae bacterium]
MKEVATKVIHIFFAPLEARKIPLEILIEGTQLTLPELLKRNERIDWTDMTTILNNAARYFSDEEFIEIGRTYFRSPGLRFAFVIGRVLLTPMGFYRYLTKPRDGAGNQMFTCVMPKLREISDRECEVELTLPEEFGLCWPFFLTSQGNMVEMPCLLGYPPAEITIEQIPRGARYHVSIPPYRGRFWAQVRRLLTWPFNVQTAARELRDAHEVLTERVLEIEDARSKLDRQATKLRITHAVNELVQRELDLMRTLDTVAKALVEEAGFAWAQITLRPPEATQPGELSVADHAERTAVFGVCENEPLIEAALPARGGEIIGDLRVSPRPGGHRPEREDLIAFIVPTIAITLQNALSYQALADYRNNLEQLIDQRTGELRQARDELAGTVVELRDAQGARERFFGNITHEIRTPLSLILLAAADIQSRAGTALDERARQNLGAVTGSAHKLLRLVDELLLLAAGQEDKLRTVPERTQFGALVDALVIAWRPAAEAAGLTLIDRVAHALIAQVDPVALERVASNLISNAVKYTPAGGQIEIELVEEPDGVRLSVFDTGPGIGDDLQSRLFGRFERAHGEAQRKTGTGLGLFLAKQLVEAHGGVIAALPREPGPGSELRVVLPPGVVLREGFESAAETTAEATAETTNGTVRSTTFATRSGPIQLLPPIPQPPQLRLSSPTLEIAAQSPVTRFDPPGFSAGTILLAEDDTQLAEMIARVLAEEYTVVVAHDGAAALELVPQFHPQLLITDVEMPRVNGIELARRFRESTGDRLAPIIVLSAMLDLGTRMAGLDAGAIDYVTKPFDPLELRARIRAQFRMRDLATRLQRAEQLTAMGILTAGLAHELRNPANGIVNAVGPLSDLLPRELVRPETAVGQLLEVLTSCADQIGFLSRQLLGFRRGVVELDLRPIPVRELVQRAVSLVHPGTVEIRVDSRCDGTLRCAPPLLMQVLTNLLENAAYAAGAGGWIAIETRVEGDRFAIEVSDSGGGVPLPLRDKVFEPFFTTKPTGVGTGLGLSLARDIVHRHGGLLEIRLRGELACFVVELPNYSPSDRTRLPV